MMPTVYSVAAGNARLAASLTARSTAPGVSVDGQAGFGQLVIGTSSLSGSSGVLAVLTLQKPSFLIANKLAALLGAPIATMPIMAGTAAKAQLWDGSGALVISGLTVGESNADIIISTENVLTTIPIQVLSATITTQ